MRRQTESKLVSVGHESYEGRAYHHLLHARTEVLRNGGDPNAHRWCRKCGELRPIGQLLCAHLNSAPLKKIEKESGLSAEEVTEFLNTEFAATDTAMRLPHWVVNALPREERMTEELSQLFSAWKIMNEAEGDYFMAESSKCMFPNCHWISKVTVRGLCQRHYNIARDLVNTNKITWRELEERGKCLAAREVMRPEEAASSREFFLEEEEVIESEEIEIPGGEVDNQGEAVIEEAS